MNYAIPLTVDQADALRRGLPLKAFINTGLDDSTGNIRRAYPENATTDELRARLIALGRGISALVEEDPDLTPPTVEACQHHAKDACRILLCLRVDQRPQEDFAGPMTIPFSGCAADNRSPLQIAMDAIQAEADRAALRG